MFKFKDLLASANTHANIIQHKDCIYSAAYNYIKSYNVKTTVSQVLPFEALFNIILFTISDEFIVILDSRQTFTFYNKNYLPVFTKRVTNIQQIAFSQDGDFFAYNQGTQVIILRSSDQCQVYTFTLTFKPTQIQFSPKNEFFVSTNKDNFQVNPTQFFLDKRITSLKQQKALLQMFTKQSFSVQSHKKIQSVFLQPINSTFDVLNYHEKLINQSLAPEEFELINNKFTSGEFANFNILVLFQSGKVQTWKPGFVKEHFAHPLVSFFLDDEINPFINEEQISGAVRVTASNYDPTTQILSFGFSNGFYYLLQNLTLIHSVSLSPYPITSILAHSTSHVAISSKFEKTVKVYNYQTQILEINDQTAINLSTFDISPDNRYLAIGQINGEIIIFDVFKNAVLTRFQAHNSDVREIKFFKSSKSLVSAGADCVVCFDLKKNVIFRKFVTEKNFFDHVSVDYSGEIIAASDQDFNVNIFDLRTSVTLDTCKYHSGPISQLDFNPNGNGELYSSSWDKTIRIMDTFSAGKPVHVLQETDEVLGFQFMENRKIATFSGVGIVNIFDVETTSQLNHINAGKLLQTGLITQNLKSTQLTSMSILGDILILGGYSKYILLYSISNQKILTFTEKIQLSINLDFQNIDSDDLREQLKDHKMPQISPDERFLINQTQKVDLKTRRFFDPIAAIEQRKLESRVIKICISSNMREVFVGTSFGIIVFERKGAESKQITAKLTEDYVLGIYKENPVLGLQGGIILNLESICIECVNMIIFDEKQATLWSQISDSYAAQVLNVMSSMILKMEGKQLEKLMQSVIVVVQRFGKVKNEAVRNAFRSLATSVSVRTEVVRNIGVKGWQSLLGMERCDKCKMIKDYVEDQIIDVKVERRKQGLEKEKIAGN